MVTELELGWLAGIFEGEGGARIYKRKNGLFWQQVEVVCNTDPVIIRRAADILDKLGIKYTFRETGNRKKKSHYSPTFDLRVNSKDNIEKFLKVLHPLTCGMKKHQVELVLELLAISRPRGIRGQKKSVEILAVEQNLYNMQHFRPKPLKETGLSN